MGCPHAAEAAETAAPEATEAATAAPTAIAGTPTHGYAPTHEAGMSLISLNVRNRGQPGPNLLAVSFSQFDPEAATDRLSGSLGQQQTSPRVRRRRTVCAQH
jgi:hypothetical protein